MNNKNNPKKSKSPKKRVIPHLVSTAVDCSVSMARQVLSGDRGNDTPTGQRIEIAAMLFEEGMDKLVDDVKKVVKL